MIKVLVVDDSQVVRDLLTYILSSDPGIQVIGTAANGEEAINFAGRHKPDLITMDIQMPGMNGFDATRRIMETNPVPIIIVSASRNHEEVEKTLLAMNVGAIAAIAKPSGIGGVEYEKNKAELISTVKLMSEVKVVTRFARYGKNKILTDVVPEIRKRTADIGVIAIGASTGGPSAIQLILSELSKDITVPILIVQHIGKGFTEGMVEWLGQATKFPIHLGQHGERPLPGHVYFAPDDMHMGVNNKGQLTLSKDGPINGLRPSVSYLFLSVKNAFRERAVGVLLTGMGKDGAQELKMMKDCGAVTIAQDEESSVVFGMPGEAQKLNAATYVMSVNNIHKILESLVMKRDFQSVESKLLLT